MQVKNCEKITYMSDLSENISCELLCTVPKRGERMEQKEFMEQIGKLISDNPAKFIKIRAAFDEVLGDRNLDSAKAISDREFERLRDKFQEIDVPFIWCNTKEAVYQLRKAVSYHRTQARDRREDRAKAKKSAKPKKKGLFGMFG